MSKRKLITATILGMMMTLATVSGYVTVKYVLDKVIDQSVTVGDTVQYTEGLFVELDTYDNYTLTYFEVDETSTTKHYVTYVYNYTVLVDNVSIEVSIIGDDITVTELVATDTTISITFSLNQDKDFNEGDIVNIQFYFEAVDNTPININTATEEELLALGFTLAETVEINYILWTTINGH